ncbi:hypothetical protein KO500_07920 [Cellulophaga baltica]|uniref:hypothetical protein n=1 Tax=Cellulophaga TaxID=104264 RepID=UPI001C076042|nr:MULTISPECIES: hypothetical protein [Cellulophaga]MBU2996357.1 hypothetical protein [Cellulophaga baltica]MDO6767753.1 hypothetical protein [Cellulophaga sp. 1_MG-2023]
MNKLIFRASCLIFVLATTQISAQNKSKNPLEEEGPIIYRFEPNYESSEDVKKNELAKNKMILDTVQVSKRERKKLLKALYSNDFSKLLSEIVTVETKFEDD